LEGVASPIVTLVLKSGLRFELRGRSLGHLGNNDYGVAYEIFVMDYYNPSTYLPSGQVKLVVDFGVNVGFSTLYFLQRFPDCYVIGLEPHPGHFEQAQRNLELNDATGRVELRRCAAGSRSRRMQLLDRGSSSSLIENATGDELSIEVVDIFPLLLGKKIDVLKMDIEGGEYEILADARFGELNITAIIMEWHARSETSLGLDDKRWCERRLQGLGYQIHEIFTHPRNGMFWATRRMEDAKAFA